MFFWFPPVVRIVVVVVVVIEVSFSLLPWLDGGDDAVSMIIEGADDPRDRISRTVRTGTRSRVPRIQRSIDAV